MYEPFELVKEMGLTKQFAFIEHWESMEALTAHMNAPHVNVFREAVKDIVEGKLEAAMYKSLGV